MKYFFLLSFLVVLGSCSGKQSLGLKDHRFGGKGKHIVWLQIPGLDFEHLAFLKTMKTYANDLTAFEKMNCMGSMWSYNLLELRPGHFNGFQSQILGSKSVEGTCKDFDRNPVWSYFENVGYSNAIYEVGAKGKQLFELAQCDEKISPFEKSVMWIQKAAPKNSQTFHFQEDNKQEKPGLYFDKSCNKKNCFSSLNSNVKALWQSFVESRPKTFFTIRDQKYGELLKANKFRPAQKRLVEIEKLLEFFMNESVKKSLLILVTSSEPVGLDFPKSGRKWQKLGRNIVYRNSKLMAPVWAFGPSSENFCATFEESEVAKRLLWEPESNFLNLAF